MKFCTRCKQSKPYSSFYKYEKKNVYRSNCRDCYNQWSREYGKKPEVKQRRNKKYATRGSKNILSWSTYIPEITRCQVCDQEIFFNIRDAEKSIHFDHTQEDCKIKSSPKIWLNRHKFSEVNKKIWDSCKFGYLCRRCNIAIPTKNRVKWFNNLRRYIESTL